MERWTKLKTWQKTTLIILAVFLLSAVVGDSPDQTETNTTDKRTDKVTISDEKSAEPVEYEPVEQESLAKKVDATYRENWGIESYTSYLISEDYPDGSLVGYITKMEDVSKGVIKVNVQTDASKEEAEGLAKNILGMVGLDITELNWVEVQTTEGRLYHAYRSEIPALR